MEAPLVLIHGATSSASVWGPVLPKLGTQRHVLTPTLAGHRGGPSLTAGPQGVVTRIVDQMCRQLDEYRVDQAHLVGNSLGGWVALELARRKRARSVLALSPAGAWRSPRDLRRLLGRFRGASALARIKKAPDLLANGRLRRVMLRAMAEHAERMTPEQILAAFEDLAGCAALADILNGARANGPIEPLSEPGCRVRILWSLHDRMLPFMRYGASMLQAVPGAEFAFLPGVGHVPMIDDPDLVAASILDFIAAVEDPSPPAF